MPHVTFFTLGRHASASARDATGDMACNGGERREHHPSEGDVGHPHQRPEIPHLPLFGAMPHVRSAVGPHTERPGASREIGAISLSPPAVATSLPQSAPRGKVTWGMPRKHQHTYKTTDPQQCPTSPSSPLAATPAPARGTPPATWHATAARDASTTRRKVTWGIHHHSIKDTLESISRPIRSSCSKRSAQAPSTATRKKKINKKMAR